MTKPTSYELLKDTYTEIRALREEVMHRFEKVEERVDNLEDFKSKMVGMVTILGAFVGAVTSWIWQRIVGK